MPWKNLFLAAAVLGCCAHLARASEIFQYAVSLPPGGVEVAPGSPFPFSVDFPGGFASIDSAYLTGTFSGDLWEVNEEWGFQFGGQTFFSGPPRSSFGLTVVNPAHTGLLLDGHENFTFQAWGGSLHLASLEMHITGVAAVVPEPSTLLLGSMASLTLAAVAWRRRSRRGTAAVAFKPDLAQHALPDRAAR